MGRTAGLYFLFGTNGTGKSTLMKQFIGANNRNLIIPANSLDKAWAKFHKIKPKFKWITDPEDYKAKRKVKRWYVPNINNYNGTAVLDLSEIENENQIMQLFKLICSTKNGFRGGGLFIDDFKNYIKTKGTLPHYVRKMLGDRRHREIDLFFATHSIQELNSDFVQFNPKLVIFNLTLPPNEAVEKKISNYDQLLETIARVKQKAKSNPYYYEGFQIRC